MEGLHLHQQKKEQLNETFKQFKVKIFSSLTQIIASLCSQLAQANTQTNYVDLALPGMLPVLNEECLDLAIKASLAFKGHINPKIKFDRKHYFYSDMPQGYQITQKNYPIMERGKLYFYDRNGKPKFINIQRIQMEQDSAKSFHDLQTHTLIDYNRAGMPLLEIVTEPEIDHPEDGKLVVKEFQDLLKALGLSEANMEEGQMRCDVNISVSNEEKGLQGNRVEIKNVLGAKFVEKAIEYEVMRHVDLLLKGEPIMKETRRYDSLEDKTISLRSKEQDPDYRFFQDPDLPCISVTPDRIRRIEQTLMPTPFERRNSFIEKYNLQIWEVLTIFSQDELVPIFEKLADDKTKSRDPKNLFNWFFTHIYGNIQKKGLDLLPIINKNFKNGDYVAELIDLVSNEKLSINNAKMIAYKIIDGDLREPLQIAQFENLLSTGSIDYEAAIDKVLKEKADVVEKILKTKKEGQIQFLVGQTLKLLRGSGDAQKIQSIIREKIGLK
eukprot:403361690